MNAIGRCRAELRRNSDVNASAPRNATSSIIPFDRAFEFRLPLRRTWWLRLAVWLAVLCFGALACALLLL